MNEKRYIISIICSLLLVVSMMCSGTVAAADKKGSAAATAQVEATLVDINHADLETLATLPGIGEKIAERITVYRDANGPFKEVDDLLNVKGIGPKMLEKIKHLITVS